MSLYGHLLAEDIRAAIEEAKVVVSEVSNSYNDSLLESAKWDINEKSFSDNQNYIKYIKNVKKLRSFIEKEVNKTSQELFNKTFKDKFSDKSEYKSELDEFYSKNKKAPKIDRFEMETDYIDFIMDGNYPGDFDLYYQDYLVKELNNNPVFKNKNIKFSSEDYPGIYIHLM